MESNNLEKRKDRLEQIAACIRQTPIPADLFSIALAEEKALIAIAGINYRIKNEVNNTSLRTDKVLGRMKKSTQKLNEAQGYANLSAFAGELTIEKVTQEQQHRYAPRVANDIANAMVSIAASQYIQQHPEVIDEFLTDAKEDARENGGDLSCFSDLGEKGINSLMVKIFLETQLYENSSHDALMDSLIQEKPRREAPAHL